MVAGLVLVCSSTSADEKGEKAVPSVLNFKMQSIDGNELDLAKFSGKVVLFVNVASKCGYTKQYAALEALYKKYSDKGLVVVGVPANEFGGQEPGTDEEIAAFCSKEYGVTFPMLAKVVVKGKDIAPLYKFLTSKETNPKFSGDIQWNFTKFLVSRTGEIVGRYEPAVKPDDKTIVDAIERELAKK
jgi:glutathione peroxidase